MLEKLIEIGRSFNLPIVFEAACKTMLETIPVAKYRALERAFVLLIKLLHQDSKPPSIAYINRIIRKDDGSFHFVSSAWYEAAIVIKHWKIQLTRKPRVSYEENIILCVIDPTGRSYKQLEEKCLLDNCSGLFTYKELEDDSKDSSKYFASCPKIIRLSPSTLIPLISIRKAEMMFPSFDIAEALKPVSPASAAGEAKKIASALLTDQAFFSSSANSVKRDGSPPETKTAVPTVPVADITGCGCRTHYVRDKNPKSSVCSLQ